MIFLLADDVARARKGILHDVRDGLRAQDLSVRTIETASALAGHEVTSDDLLLVVGGDAVTREAAEALVAIPADRRPSLGVVGSDQNDFVRTFGLDRGPFVALRHALSDVVMPIDTMAVTVDGTTVTAANAVDVGFGALLRQHRGDRDVRLRHRLAAARMLDESAAVHVTIDHTEFEEPLSRVIVSNGQFLAPDGRVSPRALPDDGRLNVQSWRIFGQELGAGLDSIHVGEHLGHERIREHQTSRITITADDPLPVAADGVVVGTTPVQVEVANHTLRLHV